MGKTGEEAPKKRELFLFSSPFFSQNSPLFAGNAKAENFGAKRERDWPEKTIRHTGLTHDLREQTERCPHRKHDGGHRNESPRYFPPIETQRRVRKWLSGA